MRSLTHTLPLRGERRRPVFAVVRPKNARKKKFQTHKNVAFLLSHTAGGRREESRLYSVDEHSS